MGKSKIEIDASFLESAKSLFTLCGVTWHWISAQNGTHAFEISGEAVPDAPQCTATVERCCFNNVMQMTVRFDAIATPDT